MTEAQRWLSQAKNDLEAATPSEFFIKQDAQVSIDQSVKIIEIVSKLIEI
jgi:hypothetical protein